jgi:Mycotoxin biosynthesis protein UstYa
MAEYDMLALGIKQPPVDTWHMDHCIDYVRQLLLCGGDMALAGQDLPNGSTNLNVPHVCKNFDQMYQWLYDNRDNDAWQLGESNNDYLPP